MKYRKKPVEVEVFRWNQKAVDEELTIAFPFWLVAALASRKITTNPDDGELYIDTLEGLMHVSDGDFIIQGIEGELYPCKPDIFAKTYELVE